MVQGALSHGAYEKGLGKGLDGYKYFAALRPVQNIDAM